MKAYGTTASLSCMKSRATNTNSTAMEERYSCHFPGCRKGAHCNCDICLDNINANLDCHSTFKSPLSLSFLLNAPMLNALHFLSILELSLHRDHVIVLKWSLLNNLNKKFKLLDGLLWNSRCVLYGSEFSSRSFTVLSGRVTEWSDRKIGYFIRKASNSRVHNPNTWNLEYESSLTLDNSMLFSAVAGVFKYRMSRALKSMNRGF
ncbi:ERG2/sigma1 receptor [Salix suchowensis]|nr:ERG2/sigma1 receptor [Salix suchowensis]